MPEEIPHGPRCPRPADMMASWLIAVALSFPSHVAAAPSDDYLAGYAASLLRHESGVDPASLIVRNGTIAVPVAHLAPAQRARVLAMLSEIPGVVSVAALEDAAPALRSDMAADTGPTGGGSLSADPAEAAAMLATGILPSGHLFQPLLADPRWAHFSAAYRNYIGNNIDGNNNGAVSFGETIPFYRANLGDTIIQWETGLQAGVFSDFNLDASSSDLINTDFIAAAYVSARARRFSAFGRVFHQSSHLGDEFLLRTTVQRVNLSYEGADLRLSYELPYGFRMYGGGGGIFHKQPSSIKPWSIQYGVEFRSPWRIDFAAMRPILAVDMKNWEQNDWNLDISARAGVQFDNLQAFGRKLQFMVEYFHGNSPIGQFYRERVEYIGIGAHYHF